MPIASFALDHGAHISSWSADAAAWFGYPAGEVLGRDGRFLIAKDASNVLAEALAAAAAGENHHRVVTVKLADGTHRDSLLTCSPLHQPDGRAGLLCEVSDLAESHRGEVQTAFMEALVQRSPFGLGILDNDLRYVLVNDALGDFNGISPEEHVGRRVGELVNSADAGEYEKHLRNVLETGEPLENVLISGRTRRRRDRDAVWSTTFFRLMSSEGRPLGLGGLVVDVTENQASLLDAAAVRQRLTLVNRASSKVGTTLSMPETARELTDFVVPEFADAAAVEIRTNLTEGSRLPLPDEPVATIRLAGHSVQDDPATRLMFADPGTEHIHPVGSPTHRSMTTGKPWHVKELDGRQTQLHDPAELAAGAGEFTENGPGSVIVVPLVARGGHCLGLVKFGRSPERQPLDEDDLRVAEELATRTALSLDNARMYDEERRIAVGLQRKMLPGEGDIPRRPGLEVAYSYWSTTRSANVGGDWFDVIPLSGHRVALVVGDMTGHDIHAAAAMGQMRTAMHTLAKLDLEPVDLLSRLEQVVEAGPTLTTQLATCVYAVFNTVTRECSIANAGHPPPVLCHGDGTTEMVPVTPGVPLGVGLSGSEVSVVELTLPEDSTLVLYTDGLVERRDQDIDEGIGALRTALSAAATWTATPVPPAPAAPASSPASPTEPASRPAQAPPLQQLCDGIVAELAHPSGEDDLAVLMARTPATPEHRSARWHVPPAGESASSSRALVRETLREWNLEALQDTTELLMSELVTNAVRHSRGDIEIQMAKGGTLVVEVADDDERLPHRTPVTEDGEWGRGLTLVDEIAQKWGARSIASGKVVWFELALPASALSLTSPAPEPEPGPRDLRADA
jgi:PAS domain S-box-containing protein